MTAMRAFGRAMRVACRDDDGSHRHAAFDVRLPADAAWLARGGVPRAACPCGGAMVISFEAGNEYAPPVGYVPEARLAAAVGAAVAAVRAAAAPLLARVRKTWPRRVPDLLEEALAALALEVQTEACAAAGVTPVAVVRATTAPAAIGAGAEGGDGGR